MRFQKHITRAMLKAERETLFVFGDNMQRTGFGGQAAEMRGEPNAVGIPTKFAPTMTSSAFFTDMDVPMVQPRIDCALGRLIMHAIGGGEIVWPMAGVGTGMAQLHQRAPYIFAYIDLGKRTVMRLSQEPPEGIALV